MRVYYKDLVGLRCMEVDTDDIELARGVVREEFVVQGAELAVINGGKQIEKEAA